MRHETLESPGLVSLKRRQRWTHNGTWLTETYTYSGPEIEHCIADEGTDPATENDWSLLPFMALSDGAHLYDTPVFDKYFIPSPAWFPLAQSRDEESRIAPNQLTRRIAGRPKNSHTSHCAERAHPLHPKLHYSASPAPARSIRVCLSTALPM